MVPLAGGIIKIVFKIIKIPESRDLLILSLMISHWDATKFRKILPWGIFNDSTCYDLTPDYFSFLFPCHCFWF